MITQAPRGTADWYGDSMAKREKVEEICKGVAATYNNNINIQSNGDYQQHADSVVKNNSGNMSNNH